MTRRYGMTDAQISILWECSRGHVVERDFRRYGGQLHATWVLSGRKVTRTTDVLKRLGYVAKDAENRMMPTDAGIRRLKQLGLVEDGR